MSGPNETRKCLHQQKTFTNHACSELLGMMADSIPYLQDEFAKKFALNTLMRFLLLTIWYKQIRHFHILPLKLVRCLFLC